MPRITPELIEAAASDQYWPSIPDEAAAPSGHRRMPEHEKQQQKQRQRMGEWHEHPSLRRWVENALNTRAGRGTEEALVGGAGIKGVGGKWT